jgi:hypothetical protein
MSCGRGRACLANTFHVGQDHWQRLPDSIVFLHQEKGEIGLGKNSPTSYLVPGQTRANTAKLDVSKLTQADQMMRTVVSQNESNSKRAWTYNQRLRSADYRSKDFRTRASVCILAWAQA